MMLHVTPSFGPNLLAWANGRLYIYMYPRNHAKVIEDEWFSQMNICGNAIFGSRLHRVRDRLPSFSTMEAKETYETKAHHFSTVAKLGLKTPVDSCFVDSFGPRIQKFGFCDCCCYHFVLEASRCCRWSRLQHLGTNWQSCSPTWRRSVWLVGWMLGCSLSLLNIVNYYYSFKEKQQTPKKQMHEQQIAWPIHCGTFSTSNPPTDMMPKSIKKS